MLQARNIFTLGRNGRGRAYNVKSHISWDLFCNYTYTRVCNTKTLLPNIFNHLKTQTTGLLPSASPTTTAWRRIRRPHRHRHGQNLRVLVRARVETHANCPPDRPGHPPLVHRPQLRVLAVPDPAHARHVLGNHAKVAVLVHRVDAHEVHRVHIQSPRLRPRVLRHGVQVVRRVHFARAELAVQVARVVVRRLALRHLFERRALLFLAALVHAAAGFAVKQHTAEGGVGVAAGAVALGGVLAGAGAGLGGASRPGTAALVVVEVEERGAARGV